MRHSRAVLFIDRAIKPFGLARRGGIGEHVGAGARHQRGERGPIREVRTDFQRQGKARCVSDDERNEAIR